MVREHDIFFILLSMIYFEVSGIFFTRKSPLVEVLGSEFSMLFDKNISLIMEALTSLPTIQSQFSSLDTSGASKEFFLYFPSFLSFSRQFYSLYSMVFDSISAIKRSDKQTAFASKLLLLIKTLKDKFIETAILSTSMYLPGEQNRYNCLTEMVGYIYASLAEKKVTHIPELSNIVHGEWHSDFVDFALNFCKCIIGKNMPFLYATVGITVAKNNLNQIYMLLLSTCREFCSIRAQCFANWEHGVLHSLTGIFQKELIDILMKNDLYHGEIGELVANEIKDCK